VGGHGLQKLEQEPISEQVIFWRTKTQKNKKNGGEKKDKIRDKRYTDEEKTGPGAGHSR